MDTADGSSSGDALEKFREEWKHELETKGKVKRTAAIKEREGDNSDDTYKARKLFLEGVEHEKLGKVFEAMRLYSRAIHIDPDIELKIYKTSERSQHKNHNNNAQSTGNADNMLDNKSENASNVDEDLTDVDLVLRFQTSMCNGNGLMFQRSNADKNVITTGLHFSDLPLEIVFYILRWVVSNNLDLRSLEQCAMVSKGFYLCARDSEIWRLACLKIWGLHVGQLKETKYTSWRQMYTERPRVWFNGCYISKTTYLRYGERSFQDRFYRPVHLVVYYRYVRFFPDGTALMLTSPDEPSQTVAKLGNKTGIRNEVLKGHFGFTNDIVIVVLKRNQLTRTCNIADAEIDSHTFCLQLQISYTKRRRCPQLLWLNYTNNCDEIKTNFDLTPTKYPALIFSRVKSYDSTSETPIQ